MKTNLYFEVEFHVAPLVVMWITLKDKAKCWLSHIEVDVFQQVQRFSVRLGDEFVFLISISTTR